jgi:hypothetical protein
MPSHPQGHRSVQSLVTQTLKKLRSSAQLVQASLLGILQTQKDLDQAQMTVQSSRAKDLTD